MEAPSGTAPPPPAAAGDVFGNRLPIAVRYAELLVGPGVERGLLGPRESPRIWERHVVNCAAAAPVFGSGLRVCDIGSGAGLPGVALAIARPDLRVTLLEPLLRRSDFLQEVVVELGLDGVEVVRGRAEDHRLRYDVTTSRAVAPLPRLAQWSLPLTEVDGEMIALKGDRAATEAHEVSAAEWERSGAAVPVVETIRAAEGVDEVTVVRVRRLRETRVRLSGRVTRPAPRGSDRRPRRP